jgi:hypothetical protein
MDGHPDVIASTQRLIDREQDLVQGAIALVAGRGSRRVTVTGLRFGEELLPVVVEAGRSKGVTVRPIWSFEDGLCEIVVEADE